MATELAHYHIDEQVAIVEIDHPPMNALDVLTKEAIGSVFTELHARREEIRVVILKGAGEKAFAAGADIKSFLELEPDSARQRLSRSHAIYRIIEDFQWPVIAAIHGFCLGGGLELALCCDVRYADETARFGFPEVKLAVFPGNGGTKRALYQVPLGRLKELIFSGDMVDAHSAFALGLVEKVTPSGEVIDSAMKLAATIKRRGPLAVAAAKKALNRARDLSLEPALDLETELWSELAATEDMKEGARSFIQKRKPTYTCK